MLNQVPTGLVKLFKRFADVDPGVVDQDVDAPVCLYSSLYHGFDLLRVGDIDCKAQGMLPCSCCNSGVPSTVIVELT